MKLDPSALFHEHLEFADRVAGSIARRLPGHVDRDDLQQAARMGLWQQAETYDPEAGASFTTFAYPRVRGAVLDHVRKSVDVPPALRTAATRITNEGDAITAMLESALGEESAEALARTVANAVVTIGVVHLASQLGDGTERTTPPSDPADPTTVPAGAEEAEQHDLLHRLREARDRLPERQVQVLRLFYEEGLTMTEAARLLRVNKSQISRDHDKALRTLRHLFGAEPTGGDRRDADAA